MGFFKNVLTFGASGRIERKLEEFEECKDEYEATHKKMEIKKTETNKLLKNLVSKKVHALKKLKKIDIITKNLEARDRDTSINDFNTEIHYTNFKTINETISTGEMAINASKGVASGIATSAGAWALVSSFGSASTGAAISGLSGVAATNATLAWFGGGSLAAGGGGMAMGGMALGGLVAIPLLALTGIFSHLSANKKIEEIEEKISEITSITYSMRSNILQMEQIDRRAQEIIISLEKAESVFLTELHNSYMKLYPYPFISKLIKSIRKNIFRLNYFSKKDLEVVAYIGTIGKSFSEIIDSKLF